MSRFLCSEQDRIWYYAIIFLFLIIHVTLLVELQEFSVVWEALLQEKQLLTSDLSLCKMEARDSP